MSKRLEHGGPSPEAKVMKAAVHERAGLASLAAQAGPWQGRQLACGFTDARCIGCLCLPHNKGAQSTYPPGVFKGLLNYVARTPAERCDRCWVPACEQGQGHRLGDATEAGMQAD